MRRKGKEALGRLCTTAQQLVYVLDKMNARETLDADSVRIVLERVGALGGDDLALVYKETLRQAKELAAELPKHPEIERRLALDALGGEDPE